MATKNTNTGTKKTATTSRGSTKTAKSAPSTADLEAQIAELKALLAAQQEALNTAMSVKAVAAEESRAVTAAPVAPATQNVVFTMPDTNVTIVYCSDSLGYAKISNMELNFTRYGEAFTLTRPQLDELVGKYRRWFDAGILTVSHNNIDVAAAKGLFTDAEVALDAKTLASLGKMSPEKLEALWNGLDKKAHRDSVVSFYKRKFIEGDPDYRDRAKVDTLNRLTNGGFVREQDELGGRYKISKTEM